MKRVFVLAFLPLVLFGFETVNLLKDHSFEKDSEVWVTSVGSKWAAIGEDSAIVSRHDSLSSFDGAFSASGDTRTTPAWVGNGGFDSAQVVYGMFHNKRIADLDSLFWEQKVIGKSNTPSLTVFFVLRFFIDASLENWFTFGYRFQNPSLNWGSNSRWIFEDYDMPEDTVWSKHIHDLQQDLIDVHMFSPESIVDSFLVIGWGYWYDVTKWYGQKVYWDNIRLMGYADYDVGVKEILSPDSGTFYEEYTPVARIKNFGRQPADSFLAIASMRGKDFILWADTVPMSLDADTEDTLTFAPYYPFSDLNSSIGILCSLYVHTVMTPDECDEDDVLTTGALMWPAGIEETAPHPEIALEVTETIGGALKVSFAIPCNQQGTLTLYDATGRRIERITVTRSGSVEFAAGLASGVYVVRLECGSSSAAKKAVVLR